MIALDMSLKQTPQKEILLERNIDKISKERFEDVSDIQIQWEIDSNFKNYTGIFAHIFVNNQNISKEDIEYLDTSGLHQNKKASEVLKNNDIISNGTHDIIVELNESMFENFDDFLNILFSRISNDIKNINLLK